MLDDSLCYFSKSIVFFSTYDRIPPFFYMENDTLF